MQKLNKIVMTALMSLTIITSAYSGSLALSELHDGKKYLVEDKSSFFFNKEDLLAFYGVEFQTFTQQDLIRRERFQSNGHQIRWTSKDYTMTLVAHTNDWAEVQMEGNDPVYTGIGNLEVAP